MRFEVNTGKRLELYQEDVPESSSANLLLRGIYDFRRYVRN